MDKPECKYLNLILDDFYICKGRLKVYKNVCPTILSAREGLKVLVRNEERKKERKKDEFLWIKQATKDGWIKMKSGGVCDVSYPTSKLRRGRVQGGGDISPTLTCESGGIVRIEVVNERFFKQAMETLENNDCEVGDTINAFNKTVDKSGCSPTITTRPEGFKTAILPVVEDKNMDAIKTEKTQEELDELVETITKPKYRIRKLTPKECWRLMNFSDEDFAKAEKVNSNSQLYRQAGNSIVVGVLCAIFSQLNIQGHKNWNSMSLSERRELIYKGTILEKKDDREDSKTI